jgi:hypothetical protein
MFIARSPSRSERFGYLVAAISLLKELNLQRDDGRYKYLAPNGANSDTFRVAKSQRYRTEIDS